MGAECCGSQVAATPTDFGKPSEKLSPHQDGKSWEDIVAEKNLYYAHRVEMFEKIKARHEAAVAQAKEENVSISITMPDGAIKEGIKGVTTPLDVANSISKSLAKKCIVSKVSGSVWDLFRPLEENCSLELLTFDDPDGKDVSHNACLEVMLNLS